MGIQEEMEDDIGGSDLISVPPVGWISALRRVAIFWAITDDQMDRRPLWEWKGSLKGSLKGSGKVVF